MKLVKKNNCEYWLNDNGQRHGECKLWYDNGQLRVHCFFVNGRFHGEFKWWYENDQIREHRFYVNGDFVRDLIEEPVTDEDKFLMTLESGGKWI